MFSHYTDFRGVGQHLFKSYDMFHVHGAEQYYLTDANLVFDEKKAKSCIVYRTIGRDTRKNFKHQRNFSLSLGVNRPLEQCCCGSKRVKSSMTPDRFGFTEQGKDHRRRHLYRFLGFLVVFSSVFTLLPFSLNFVLNWFVAVCLWEMCWARNT